MNIEQILNMPVGQKFGGFDVVIKTAKKRWELDGAWMQQIIITDETGDALADVNIKKNIPLRRGSSLYIIVGEVQQGVTEVGSVSQKKIYIDQFTLPSQIGEPAIEYNMTDKITRSKIKCWLVAATLQAGNCVDKQIIDGLVDYVME